MTLRARVLMISAAIVALGALAAAAIGSHVVLDGFRELEQDAITRDLERARAAIDTDLDNIAAVATDWGVWDDTRAFVADPAGQQDFLASNLPTATFVGLSLNLIVLTDDASVVHYAGAVDLATEAAVDPASVVATLRDRGLMAPFDDPDGARTGLVRIGDRLLALSVRSITDSEGEAAPNGTLTMARWVTDEVVADLAERTRLDLTIAVDGTPVTEAVQTTSGDTITARAPMADIAGDSVAELAITEPRSILAQGQGSVRSMTLVVVGVLIAAGVLLLLVTDRLVLRRLRRLGREIELVGASADGSRRVTVDTGADEVTEVADHLNQTLRTLERAQQDLQLRNLELEQTNAELQAANRERRRFLSAVSHDLRTPLTSIRGFATLLHQRWDDLPDEQRRTFFELIENRVVTIDGMVDDLLVLSRLEQGTVVAQPADLVMADVLPVLVEQLPVPGVEVVGAEGAVRADPEHLRRILANLVDNAHKYGAAPIEVSAADTRDGVELRVRDHGRGIEEGFESSLFEAFSQARPSGDSDGGVGLGLSIVQHLTSENGGSVAHDRTVTPGACFVVRLPRAARATQEQVLGVGPSQRSDAD